MNLFPVSVVYHPKRSGLLLCLLLLEFARLALAGPPEVGARFPDLGGFVLEGRLPDRKGKVVLVDFFASWCGPCKQSFPVMEELHREFGDRGLVIIAVNVDTKREEMESFLRKYPASFAVVRDGGNKLVSSLAIPTMPCSFLIDRDGRVSAFHRGFKGDESKRAYRELIQALLK